MRLRSIVESSDSLDEFDLQQKAENMAQGDNKQKVIIANQLKSQNDALQKSNQERKRQLEPEIKRLNTSATKLSNDINQDKLETTARTSKLNDMSRSVNNISNSANAINNNL